ncbi:Ras modification protein [Lachnellula occidentalis]|uniref:Ras modification protein ERF4 n=1 Tax=Lachnellula occidentalis TaxID=215460 RepID=A0A8H8S7I3_9HELO|nr:Ras modification protein [Lachnellula occidentalis]
MAGAEKKGEERKGKERLRTTATPTTTTTPEAVPLASQAGPSKKVRKTSITHLRYPQSQSQSESRSSNTNAAGSSTANPRIPSPTFQPPYPSAPSPNPTTEGKPQVRVTSPTRWNLRSTFTGGGNPEFNSPFRSRSGTGGSSLGSLPRHPVATRGLWNPTNSTPRAPARKRNRSQGEDAGVIAIPLSHPDLSSPRQGSTAGGSYPLLTLPEKRRSLHLGSAGANLQVERSGSSQNSHRISLPRSVSIDIQQRKSGESTPPTKLDKGKGRAIEPEEEAGQKTATGFRNRDQSIYPQAPTSGLTFDKGKSVMSTDLERGPPSPYNPQGTSRLPRNVSNTSLDAGIGAALSEDGTSIVGSDGPGAAIDEWGPQHPCFPHMNPHVPLSSPLYQSTRILRIRRDWMLAGDLAPTFSNMYPEVLDPAGVSEQEFRMIIDRVNKELIHAFNPWGLRNMFDNIMGILTGWVWEDFGFTAVKSRLQNVERYLEEWNKQMQEKSKEGPDSAARIVPLRRTGYMNLDFQIPDPDFQDQSLMDRSGTGQSGATQ